MIKFAITGNIASGKSTVEKVLEKHGFVVLDTDLMVHDILIDRPEVSKAFEDYDVFEFGRLSRDKLGKLVFNDSELKTKLESIVHPLVLEEIETAFKVYSEEKYLFISVPLLFEVGWEKLFDKIIFVKTDDEIRIERLIKRNGYTREYAVKRLEAQAAQDIKVSRSDIVIENDDSIDNLILNVEGFIEKLSQES